MSLATSICAATMFIAGVLVLWFSTMFMISKKLIIKFIPFFIVGILLFLTASLKFHNIFIDYLWGALDLGWIIVFIWIFIVIRRENGN